MLQNLFMVVVCWLFAGIFAVALLHKLNQRQRFLAALRAYRLLPDNTAIIALSGYCLAALEIVTLALLLGLQALGLWLAMGLFSVYFVAMLVNVVRGRKHIDCGCGDEPASISSGVLVRNFVLVILAVVALEGGSVPMDYALGLVGFGLATLACGLYFALDQLLINKSRHQRLWLGVV